jgi:hypothetical protein
MKVFISWSGERSGAVATALKVWLGDVLHDIDVWTSGHDINAGARWGTELDAVLEASSFGILCLTPENLDSPWILFEAGSLAKAVRTARVVPYLLALSPTEVRFPLAQFQAVKANEAGTLSLVEGINNTQEHPLEAERLQRAFAKWWPDLESRLIAIPPPQTATPPLRTERELLEEMLELIRKQPKLPSVPFGQEGIRNLAWQSGKLPPPTASVEFLLVNVKGGNFLQAATVDSNGRPIDLAGYTGDDPQLWSLHEVQKGYFAIRSISNGQCMDVDGSSMSDGARVYQWEYHGGDNQKWALLPQKDGAYRFRCKHSERYLTVHDGYLTQMGEIDTRAQRWWLVPIVR